MLSSLKGSLTVLVFSHAYTLVSCFIVTDTITGILDGTLSSRLQQEISSYQDIADKIIRLSVNGNAQNQSYNRLAEFTDKFGNRLSGTQNLENAIDYMLDQLKKDGLENVHGESVMVPHWVRGSESAAMLEPRRHSLSMLGLGSSVGTPQMARGKIIVYNQEFVSYGVSVAYRTQGASEAAKVGAVASLIRSVTPFSISSPHTGIQFYEKGVTKIPTACITVEDAEMMNRMADRGEKIVVLLKMEAQNLPDVESRNTVAEIVGHQYPEQVVLLSGHLDSWDVGQGAMDDGGGVMISWQALSLVKQLGLRPRRTMRVVMWTAEEQRGIGSQQYYDTHKVNISNYDLVMESDIGTFKPYGIQFSGNKQATTIMSNIVKFLQPINASQLAVNASGADIEPWMQQGVPGVSLYNDYSKYFYFHHSNGDTMTVQDPHEMNLCSAVWAVVAYIVADLEDMLPR